MKHAVFTSIHKRDIIIPRVGGMGKRPLNKEAS